MRHGLRVFRAMCSRDRGGSGVVDNDGARRLHDAAEHRVIEVTEIHGRTGALRPEFFREMPLPFAVVEDEFLYVLLTRQGSEHEMVQNSVVQHDDARGFERAAVDIGVESVVAEMVEG